MILFFLLLAVGVTSIAGITIIGAIASKKYKFDFVSLSIVSLVVYIVLGAIAASKIDTTAAVTLTGLLGLFEATIAWKWINQFDAYIDESSDQLREIIEDGMDPPPSAVIMIVMVYMFLGWIVSFFV